MGLNLLDLDCILISKEIHTIELNEERKVLTTDELYDLIHSKKLNYAELVSDEEENNPLVYVNLYNDELMLGVV